jgi:hypothetical protein
MSLSTALMSRRAALALACSRRALVPAILLSSGKRQGIVATMDNGFDAAPWLNP